MPNPLVRLARVAMIAAAVDLFAKAMAVRLWSSAPLHVTNWLSLAVIENHAGAFGLSAGSYTWQLNLALTLAAIVFVIPVTRDLTTVDRSAPTGLGLIVGGALGNLMSLVAPPAGVVDFIAVHFGPTEGIVLNLADIAAYAGLAMILRTGFRIAEALVTRTKERERIGSVYATKADAKRQLRRIRIERTPEVLVAEFDHVAMRPHLTLADAPERSPRGEPIPRPHSQVEPIEEIRVISLSSGEELRRVR